MKNILLNKKWLGLIALLFLVLSLSSCSAFGYWWGEVEQYEYQIGGYGYYDKEFESPMAATMWSMFGAIDFFSEHPLKCNFFSFIVGAMWLIAIPSFIFYFFGRTDGLSGVKEYKVEVNGQKHTVRDYSESYADGCGSVKRGNGWSDLGICFIFCVLIYYIMYSMITGWFDDLNMLFKVIIGGGIIVGLYRSWGMLLPISSLLKYISWVFCTIDFILGVLVTLWIN